MPGRLGARADGRRVATVVPLPVIAGQCRVNGSLTDADTMRPKEARATVNHRPRNRARAMSGDTPHPLLRQLLAAAPPRAAAFIVTVYGDVVEPRGGVLWIGNLIDTCACVGISESLVRTAVSRLVAAGQLTGERVGRRSYYRLTPQARAEFAYAARILYAPDECVQWRLVYLTGSDPDTTLRRLRRLGYAALNSRLVIGPDAAPLLPGEALVWDATVVQGRDAIRSFAAEYWDLAAYAGAYHAFIGRFRPVLARANQLAAQTALAVRLLLVHEYRGIVLRAPRLPADALPPGWSGHCARRLFASLYLALSEQADRHVASHFVGAGSALSDGGVMQERRLAQLRTLI